MSKANSSEIILLNLDKLDERINRLEDGLNLKIDKIDNKFENLDKTLSDMTGILTKQEMSLAEHIKRTNILETTVKPLTQIQAFWSVAGKIMTIIGAGIGVLTGIAKLFGWF